MFVGGLNWETTNESLEKYFSQFGKIDACTIMRDGAGRSRGFAFLTFEDPAAVNAVMVREHYLDGKIIDPKRAIPRLEHQRTQKIFVGGLAPSVTAETLKKFFSQHGRVVDATVMVDRDSSRSKGFGFVTFEDGTGVEKLVGHGMVIDGKGIEVKLAQPRHAQQREQQPNGAFTTAGGGTTGNGSAYQSNRTADAYTSSTSPNNSGSAPTFDAQAMANLYQRMMAVSGGNFMGGTPMMGGGGMNPMMMGGMGMGRGMPGPMMGGGPGMGMGGMPGMGMGGMAPGGMMGGNMGMMGGGPMGGMGRGGPMAMGGGMGGMGGGPPMGAGGGMGGHIPRGPRAGMQQAQQHPGGPQGGGAGPMRSQGMRGQSAYHPYGR
ncbi:hypothetical protein FRC02_007608 [Tulasnella sp. 418]|nr:hypothetical protein FRC02_007608 [Tulasnella sp. 418]